MPLPTNRKRKLSRLLLEQKLPVEIVEDFIEPCFPIQCSAYDLVVGELLTIFAEKSSHSWHFPVHFLAGSQLLTAAILRRAKTNYEFKAFSWLSDRIRRNALSLRHNRQQLY